MMLSHQTAVIAICFVMYALHVTAAVKKGLRWHTGVMMSSAALLLCMICARLYYIAAWDLVGAGFFGPLFPQDPYSYAFGGGVLGYLLAVWLTSRFARQPLSAVGDAFAPAGLATIAALRLAEGLSDFGWGDMIETAWLQRYPFAIQNMFGEWCAAVFNLEALCALVIAVVILSPRFQGRRLTVGLLWWAVTQIFCESLRVESIQWGFVRVQQLLSAIVLAVMLLMGTLRLPRGKRRPAAISWLVFAACIGAVIFLEYALDKIPWPIWIDYAAMAAVLAVMGLTVQKTAVKKA